MDMRVRTSLLVGLVSIVALVSAAPATAASPGADAYGGLPSEPTLPFTGMDLGLVLAVAAVLIAVGLVIRHAAAVRSD
jgi:hypothetical protein